MIPPNTNMAIAQGALQVTPCWRDLLQSLQALVGR
jgi:hypothetical protein